MSKVHIGTVPHPESKQPLNVSVEESLLAEIGIDEARRKFELPPTGPCWDIKTGAAPSAPMHRIYAPTHDEAMDEVRRMPRNMKGA